MSFNVLIYTYQYRLVFFKIFIFLFQINTLNPPPVGYRHSEQMELAISEMTDKQRKAALTQIVDGVKKLDKSATDEWISQLDPEVAAVFLTEMIEQMDGLDTEDFFGTEGWRHHMGIK